MTKETHVCSICKKKFTGFGNNPAPVRFNGRCCDKCNQEYVIPARLALLRKGK